MTLMSSQPPRPHLKRWTKREYNRLTELGAFDGQKVYLFRGSLIEMSPQHHPHAFAVTKLTNALFAAFGVNGGYDIRIQLPFDVPGESMPEPDGLVCTAPQGLRQPHPNEALLAVEVADSSLEEDRDKAFEYAAASVPEYWIIDVHNRQVELYRDPIPDKSTELGARYSTLRLLNPSDSIELLARPGVSISLAQVFT
jgi:Uma2 family endonuclease